MGSPHATRSAPLRRSIAGALCAVYLALGAGAGLHVGGHDDGDLSWLPEEFHHHAYALEEGPDDRPLVLADDCLACELTRLGRRLDVAVPRVPRSAEVDARLPRLERWRPDAEERGRPGPRGPPSG